MNKPRLSDRQVIISWQNNASPWIAAVREQQIESRRLITDAAIVQAVLDCQPSTVLDIGCGEGWLAHTLVEHGMQVLGVDVVAELVDAANAERSHHLGNCEFRVMSYEEIAAGGLSITAVKEPVHSAGSQPASLILVASNPH